jgi:carboxyl-terminal processing protease
MRMNGLRTRIAPAAVAVVAIVTGGWLLQRNIEQERSLHAQARMFEEALRHVTERFVDAVDPQALGEGAVAKLVESLGDPHSAFMRPADFEALRVRTQGEYAGIGAEVGRRGEWITVIAPLPESPAERAGLQAGDRILAIDGASTRGWTQEQARDRLRGPRDTPVALRIGRGGAAQPLEVSIVRREIRLRAVPSAFLMENGIGYVELSAFSPAATRELQAALDRLREDGVRGVILDLRRNPGGLLDQGIAVADLFLSRGLLIAETRSRVAGQSQRAFATGRDRYPELPLVVLVGPASASAAEIVAGALQDHDRALVVGRASYGKGLVQTLHPLPGDNWLKLSTARWYTPAGRSIQRPLAAGGMEPEADVHAELYEEDGLPQPAERPAYRTAGGRVVYGGGGIHPDLVVRPDTLTTTERAFATELFQEHLASYLAARLEFAVRHVREQPALRPGFPVTAALRAAFHDALVEAGIPVDREEYDAAARWIELELGSEITYSRWGEQERRRRQNAADAQVRAAAGLLARAATQASLFELAQPAVEARAAAAPGLAPG